MPAAVAAPAGAGVFLVPTEERIRATAAERQQRPVLVERNLLLAKWIAAAAAGLAVLDVDRPLENDVLAEQVRLYRESGDAPPRSPPLAFACECGGSGCTEFVQLSLEDYLSVGADRSTLRRPRT